MSKDIKAENDTFIDCIVYDDGDINEEENSILTSIKETVPNSENCKDKYNVKIIRPIDPNDIKFGEIFLSNNGAKLYFICYFCSKSYYKIQNYVQHCVDDHDIESWKIFSFLQDNKISNASNTTKNKLKHASIENIFKNHDHNYESRNFYENAEILSDKDDEILRNFKKFKPDDNLNDSEAQLEELSGEFDEEYLEEYKTSLGQSEDSDDSTDFEDPADLTKLKYCIHCLSKVKNFKLHMRIKHSDLLHKCETPYCYELFLTEKRLKEHIAVIHRDPEKPFACKNCDYKTNKKKSLDVHFKRIHLNIRNKKCSYCEKTFYDSGELKKHERVHTGERPAICYICGKGLRTTQDLNKHILRDHEAPTFNCKVCGKKFHLKETLLKHNFVHSNERPNICHVCGKAFKHVKYLREHIDLHSGTKKYECKTCGKKFAQKNNYTGHQKIHTKTNKRENVINNNNTATNTTTTTYTFKDDNVRIVNDPSGNTYRIETVETVNNHQETEEQLRKNAGSVLVALETELLQEEYNNETQTIYANDFVEETEQQVCSQGIRSVENDPLNLNDSGKRTFFDDLYDSFEYKKCKLCNVKTGQMLTHLKYKHPNAIKCNISDCNMPFDSEEEYNAHKAELHINPNFPFQCKSCSYKCKYRSGILNHYNRIHLQKPKFQCNLCDKSFYAYHVRKRHIKECHNNGKLVTVVKEIRNDSTLTSSLTSTGITKDAGVSCALACRVLRYQKIMLKISLDKTKLSVSDNLVQIKTTLTNENNVIKESNTNPNDCKFGEIYLALDGRIYFVCKFCEANYYCFKSFQNHFLNDHAIDWSGLIYPDGNFACCSKVEPDYTSCRGDFEVIEDCIVEEKTDLIKGYTEQEIIDQHEIVAEEEVGDDQHFQSQEIVAVKDTNSIDDSFYIVQGYDPDEIYKSSFNNQSYIKVEKSNLEYKDQQPQYTQLQNCPFVQMVVKGESPIIEEEVYTQNEFSNDSQQIFDISRNEIEDDDTIDPPKDVDLNCHQIPKHFLNTLRQIKYGRCKFCNRRYEDLNSHYKQYLQKFVCHISQCSEPFDTINDLNEHFVVLHSDTEFLFKCFFCDFKDNEKQNLILHYRKSHLLENTFKCSKCDFESFSQGELEAHDSTHATFAELSSETRIEENIDNNSALNDNMDYEDETEPNIKDKNIDTDSDTSSGIGETDTRRKENHHIEVDDPLHPHFISLMKQFHTRRCKICKVKSSLLSTHYRKIHFEKFTCDINQCSEPFDTEEELAAHTAELHIDPENPFKCAYCEYKTTEKRRLSYHYRRNHLVEKKYECNYCPMKFFYEKERVQHHRVHTGEHPFSCDLCGQAFKTAVIMRMHKKRKHEPPSESCDICGKMFSTKENLKNHLKRHLGTLRCICHICGISFSRPQCLRNHLPVHSGEVFECNLCQRKFTSKQRFNDHLKLHKKYEKFELGSIPIRKYRSKAKETIKI
ncbi:uncharacterized protein LOC129615809 [Condylostylus longicornis]|uniref:uncharacterized protein LOC129615809 n=1 Tax=Condylostylus longicornis TaxID=2530218 RepID=UPI00244E23AE|nr:uncharacterized protein LOC129615809 [Condylostylus longicornis]